MTKKKTPKRKPSKPSKPVKPGKTGVAQDKASGKFLPGNNGGAGRPKGIDIRKAAQDAAVRAGIDLDEAMGDLLLKMVNQGLDGDVPAAKLAFDRLCGPVEPAPVLAIIDKRPPPEMGPDEDDDWQTYFDKLTEVTLSIKPIAQNGKDR